MTVLIVASSSAAQNARKPLVTFRVITDEDQQLMSSIRDFSQDGRSDIAGRCLFEDRVDAPFKIAELAGDGAGGGIAEAVRQCEDVDHPNFKRETNSLITDLKHPGDVACQVRQACLVLLAMALLR